MRSKLMLPMVLMLASATYAKEPYQTGKLLQMDSIQCGTAEKDNSSHKNKKTKDLLCQEYTLQAERVIYRIRPRDEKHPGLLPVGDRAEFRLQKDKMLLRIEELDNKEREYVVVSITPRTDSNTADAAPARLNHLQ
jgi:hypothetical protein